MRDVSCRQQTMVATWNRWHLFSSHPQEVSDVELPDVERHSVSLQLFHQLLLAMMAAAAQADRHIIGVLWLLETAPMTGEHPTLWSQWHQHKVESHRFQEEGSQRSASRRFPGSSRRSWLTCQPHRWLGLRLHRHWQWGQPPQGRLPRLPLRFWLWWPLC